MRKDFFRMRCLACVFLVGIVLGILFIPSEPHFKIYQNESGNLVKVNNIKIGNCNQTGPTYWAYWYNDGDGIWYEEMCRIISKKELTVEWLNKNAICVAEQGKFQKILSCNIWNRELECICNKYQYKNYTVETWRQLK